MLTGAGRPGGETAGTDGQAFAHSACIYRSNQEFLAMAVPFLAEGLSRGEPVLAVTTPANLELVNAALGARGSEMDYAESAYFGRRPAHRIAAFHRYWKRRAARGRTRVRVLAEPVWTGRSAREILAWKRMESTLNVALATTTISMICPYDARILPAGIIAGAGRTHPAQVTGAHTSPCPDYSDPTAFARECDTSPLPDPPARAAAFQFDGDLRGLRQFVARTSAAHGLAGDRAMPMVQAASEVGGYLKGQLAGNATVRAWEQPGAVICDFRQLQAAAGDPFVGMRPAELSPQPADGLWLAGQLCDWIDIRSGPQACTIRLQVPSRRSEEMAQQP
jgi:hypothetical protein